MSGASNGYTPTERKIMDVLQDGEPHDRQEIIARLDPMMELSALIMHIHRMRAKLPVGHHILAVTPSGRRCRAYQLVRHVNG